MGGASCVAKEEMKKGPWTREEDQKLLAYIQEHGHGSWRNLPAKAGLQRCGKSCRLRWTNYLRPDIKRGKFSTHEEKTIVRLHALLGNRWSAIAVYLPKRTDNEIKNYWNTRLKKRLTRMGIDPTTHKPKNIPAGSAQSRHASALSHMAQWETARLEAEARLTRESKLRLLHNAIAPPPPPAAPPCLDVLRAWQAAPNRSCSFFTSPGTLESPTSTLNFSSGNITVPAVSSVTANHDVMSVNNYYGACVDSDAELKGKMENSIGDGFVFPSGYGFDAMGSVDPAAFDHGSNGYDSMVDPVFEDCENYWNDLLDLVRAGTESPTSYFG